MPQLSPARIDAIHSRNCWSPSLKLPPVVSGFVKSQIQDIQMDIPNSDLPVKLQRPRNYLQSPTKLEQIQTSPLDKYFFSRVTVGPDDPRELEQMRQIARIQSGFSPSRLVEVLKLRKIIPEEKQQQQKTQYLKMEKYFEFNSSYSPNVQDIIHLFPYSFQENKPLSSVSQSISRQYARQSCQVLNLKSALPQRVSLVQKETHRPELQKSAQINKAKLRVEETQRKDAMASRKILEIACGFRQNIKSEYCLQLQQLIQEAIQEDENVVKGASDDVSIRAIVQLIDSGLVGSLQKHVAQIVQIKGVGSNQREFLLLLQVTAHLSLLGPQLREIFLQTKIYQLLKDKLVDILKAKTIQNKFYLRNPDFFNAIAVIARMSTDFSLGVLPAIRECLKNILNEIQNPYQARDKQKQSVLDESSQSSDFEPDHTDPKVKGLLLRTIAKQRIEGEQDGINAALADKLKNELVQKPDFRQSTKQSIHDTAIQCCFATTQVLFGCLQEVFTLQVSGKNSDDLIDNLQNQIKEIHLTIVGLYKEIKIQHEGEKAKFSSEMTDFGHYCQFKLTQKNNEQLGDELLSFEGWDENTLLKISHNIQSLFEQ